MLIMNWKGFERKRFAYFKVLYRHLSGETEENHEKPQLAGLRV
jgi:hypothetical protein